MPQKLPVNFCYVRSFTVVVLCSKLFANINTQTTFSVPYPVRDVSTLQCKIYSVQNNIMTTEIALYFTTFISNESETFEKKARKKIKNKIVCRVNGNKISWTKTLNFVFIFRASPFLFLFPQSDLFFSYPSLSFSFYVSVAFSNRQNDKMQSK